MTKPTIFITSASEISGYDCAEELLSKRYKDKFEVICGVSPDQSGFMDKLRGLGAKVKEVDPKSMSKDHIKNLFKDVGLVYIVPPLAHGVDTTEACKLYMDACKEAEIQNVVLLTAIQPKHYKHKNPSEGDEDMHHHFEYLNKMKEIEKHLLDCSFKSYAIVRRAMYQDLFLTYCDKIKNDKVIPWPLGWGSMAPIKKRDVSRFVAKICCELTMEEQGLVPILWSSKRWMMHHEHRNKTFTLTGPRALNGDDMAMIATHALSKPIKIVPTDKYVYVGYKDVSRDEAAKFLNEDGTLSPDHINLLLDIFDVAKRGDLDFATHDYKNVVGWPAEPLHAFMTENSGSFAVA